MVGVAKIGACETRVNQVIFVGGVILAGKLIYHIIHDGELFLTNHFYIFSPHGSGDYNNVDIVALAPVTYLVKILHVVVHVVPVLAAVRLLGGYCFVYHLGGVETLGCSKDASPSQAVAVTRNAVGEEVIKSFLNL